MWLGCIFCKASQKSSAERGRRHYRQKRRGRIAVVGAGPAGVCAALLLAAQNYNVQVRSCSMAHYWRLCHLPMGTMGMRGDVHCLFMPGHTYSQQRHMFSLVSMLGHAVASPLRNKIKSGEKLSPILAQLARYPNPSGCIALSTELCMFLL